MNSQRLPSYAEVTYRQHVNFIEIRIYSRSLGVSRRRQFRFILLDEIRDYFDMLGVHIIGYEISQMLFTALAVEYI